MRCRVKGVLDVRVAKNPVALPANVEAVIADGELRVKPVGSMARSLTAGVSVVIENGAIKFAAVDESKHARAMSGTLRALAANMVKGCRRFRAQTESGWRGLPCASTG